MSTMVFMMEEDLGNPMKLGFQLFVPHPFRALCLTQGTSKLPRALQREESSSAGEAPFILKVASSAGLCVAPGHPAEPKERALQLVAPPGMESRSGSRAGLTGGAWERQL